ncbi:MAG: hypothetical protein C0631_09440 [Sedimenticola sp.]|nr:MAG: hypothetical protein C0631_09440 [Sedimenticola sp.]
MTFHIKNITKRKNSRLIGSHIDSPKAGMQSDAHELNICGWVLGQMDATSSVVIYCLRADLSDQYLGEFNIEIERPDVISHFQRQDLSIKCGFAIALPLYDLHSDQTLILKLKTNADEYIQFAEIAFSRKKISSDYQPSLNPIIVSTLGRTGSTLLMRLLSEHPDIVVANKHPYETFALEYWLYVVYQFLSEPEKHLQKADTSRFQRDFQCSVQRKKWFSNKYSTDALYFCQQQIEAYYKQIIAETNSNPPIYFAEKLQHYAGEGIPTWPYLKLLVKEVYPQVKEIILVRDFRDVILSSIYFGTKHIPGYDIEKAKNEAYLGVIDEIREFSNYYMRYAESSLLVRYEDLINDPLNTLKVIFDFLSLTTNHTTINSIVDSISNSTQNRHGHITSGSISKSISRWRQELSPEQQLLYADVFRQQLSLFGYPTSN